MDILTQFLFRLSFGLAAAMAATSPQWVTAGYFRVHLYVILGLGSLASAVAWSRPERFPLAPPLLLVGLAYVGSVCWLYESRRAGRTVLVLVALVALAGAWLAHDSRADGSTLARVLEVLDPVAGGLVLGVTMAAMLLGHWYLNTPTMRLDPLRRLIVGLLAAVAGRSLLAALGLAAQWQSGGDSGQAWLLFVALRWLSGLVGTAVVGVMAWETLKIPNTQSATGILYVGVITTFLGELSALLLSAESIYPL